MLATITNIYLIFYVALKFKLFSLTCSLIASPHYICLAAYHWTLVQEFITLAKVVSFLVLISAKITFQQLLERVLASHSRPPASNPQKDPKNDWREKLKRFYKEYETEIKFAGLALGVGVLVYLYFKFGSSGGGSNPRFDDSDDEQQSIPFQDLPEETRFALRLGQIGASKRDKKDVLLNTAEPLLQHLTGGDPRWGDYTAYVFFIVKICEFVPGNPSYVVGHLTRVLSSLPNSSTSSNFERLAHCLQDPTYATQEALTRLRSKMFTFEANNDTPFLNSYLTALFDNLNVFDHTAATQALTAIIEAGDESQLEELLNRYLFGLKSGGGDPQATSAAIDGLADVLRQAKPFCKHF